MQANHGPRSLHLAHLAPECRVWLDNLQVGIQVVRNYGQYRADSEFPDHRRESLPPHAIHGGAKVVEADAGRSLHAPYQRKMNVLTVHNEVASAMPATPNQRISTRFRTISSPRLIAPQ